MFCLSAMSATLRKADIDTIQAGRIDSTISTLVDLTGANERIFKSPIPLVYTRHTSRFVGVWLALLPLAMWANDPSWNHLASIPSAIVIAFFLLGVEELGLQIEEPFGISPMEAFCDGSIGAVLNEMVQSEDKKRKEEAALRASMAPALKEVGMVVPKIVTQAENGAEQNGAKQERPDWFKTLSNKN